ncbi:hypothetical protein ACHAQA_007596 [Verticillium albo-atrum]
MSRVVDFRCSTSSKIIRDFSPVHSASNMVDFCLVFKPAADVARLISTACGRRPGRSINHTNSGALRSFPIGLTLQFKSPGADVAMAMLQMGTWHTAQWRSLSFGVPKTTSPAVEFLPGIIVQGHQWYFVATVPPPPLPLENQCSFGLNFKPTLYSLILLGTTEHADGIYKIIAALRCLVGWLETSYWPAFQRQVLQQSIAAYSGAVVL